MLMMSSTSMAASYTTTSAVIQPPLAEEESHNPTTNNEENNKTIGPITDIARKTSACTETEDAQNQPSLAAVNSQLIESTTTSTSSIPFHSNLNAKTNSKIPYPLATLLASKTQQIRRSASLRLRGTKSNLLFNTFTSQQQRNNNNHSMRIEQVNTTPTTSTHKRASSNTMKNEITDNQEVTHNMATTGRFSPRRKVVLNSTQQLNVHGSSGLTRSLSLKGNQNSKTDINTEESSCTVTDALNELTLNDNANLTKEPTPQALEIGGNNDIGVPALNTNDVNQSIVAAANGDNTYVVAQPEHKKDTVKMSLNLNGPTSTAATAAATAATTTTTNVRPSSLITTTTPSKSATGNSATSSKAVTNKAVTSVRTPKTPTTILLQSISNTNSSNHHQQQQQQQQQHHNHHHHHQHCSKQQYQQALPSVPETKLTPKTPPVTPDSPSTYLEDDLDSMYSFATTTSGRSTMSCEHPYVARNGTTFSGRKMKYVVHCSNYAGQVGPDYLTPTQRAQRQVKRLKELLCVARQDLEQKDSEILRLTREVVELRLFKASLSSPEDRSASSDAVTVREAELKTSQDVSPIVDMVDDGVKSSPRHILHHHHHNHSQHNHVMQHSIEMQSSFADSGHFEDMTSSSVHSKDSSSYAAHTHDMACGSDEVASGETAADDLVCQANSYEVQRQELIRMYEQRIEELIRTQDTATSEIKRSHNDKVEALLQKLAECNTRYADIVPDYEHAKERIRELEKQLEDLQRKLAEHEEKQNKMYLHMYQKGQEAERIARADQALELVHRAPTNKVSINELLHQLQSTQDELENIRAAECRNETGSNHALLTAKEAISLWVLGARKTIYRRLLDAQKNRAHVDPEVTLQFLKSAVYYFLTDKENSQGHLQAIESILEFTEAEKQNINRARAPK